MLSSMICKPFTKPTFVQDLDASTLPIYKKSNICTPYSCKDSETIMDTISCLRDKSTYKHLNFTSTIYPIPTSLSDLGFNLNILHHSSLVHFIQFNLLP